MSSIGTRTRQLNSQSANANFSRRKSIKRNGLNTITATDISFTNPGTIASAGSGFARLAVGTVISVLGSALNSRDYVVATSSAASITVLPALITTEAAAPLIQIYEN